MDTFIKKFSELFEVTEPSEFSKETRYRELDEWNSLLALSVLLMIDEEYGVNVSAAEIGSTSTIEELYQLVQSKK